MRVRPPVALPARPTLCVSGSELVLLRAAETDARPSRAIRWNWKTGDRKGAAVAAPHSQQVAVSPDGQSIAWFEAAPTPGAAAQIRTPRPERRGRAPAPAGPAAAAWSACSAPASRERPPVACL